jgi:CBS domain containing-hemolysin-like protein
MARISLQTGGIKHYQESVIDNILSLETKTVKDVMTPRTVIFSLSEHLSLEEASQRSTKWEHSRFPVYDKEMEDVVGIVLTKELFIALSQGTTDLPLTELMRPVHFVAETAKLNNVLMEFMETRQKLFVVIDEYGGLSGLITLEDILEEILGREIIDESDQVVDKRELARRRRSNLISRRL